MEYEKTVFQREMDLYHASVKRSIAESGEIEFLQPFGPAELSEHDLDVLANIATAAAEELLADRAALSIAKNEAITASLNLAVAWKGIEDRDREIARLTPTMTGKLPSKPGWYWRIVDDDSDLEAVKVCQDLDGRPYLESTDDDGTLVINLVLHGKWWSAEPIPMPVVEKEETE